MRRCCSSSAARASSPIRTSIRSSAGFCRAYRAPGIALDELPTLDAMLLTHAHADHLSFDSLDRLPRTFRSSRRRSIARWLRAARLSITRSTSRRARQREFGDGDDPRRGARRIAATATASIAGAARRTCICSTPARRVFFAGDTALVDDTHRSRRARALEARTRARSRAAADRLRAVVEAGLSQGPSHARRRARRCSSGFARACSCRITGARFAT